MLAATLTQRFIDKKHLNDMVFKIKYFNLPLTPLLRLKHQQISIQKSFGKKQTLVDNPLSKQIRSFVPITGQIFLPLTIREGTC